MRTKFASLRILVLLVFALAWVSACVGCGASPPRSPTHRELASRLESETVALVKQADDSDRWGVYCAGVWIGPDRFLTAAHCVSDIGAPSIYQLFEALGASDGVLPPWNPVGQTVDYSEQSDLNPDGVSSYHEGLIVKFDKARDLALVRTLDKLQHATARLSQAEIADGDRVEVVGHPMGHIWSYAEGYVSATRPTEPNAEALPMDTLQIDAAVSHGNSGCGAFDAQGDLIGVGSYVEPYTNGMGFFVHRNAIRTFLKGT